MSRIKLLSFPVALTLWAGSCAETGSVPRHCRGIEPNGPELTGVSMTRAPAAGCPLVEGIQLRVTDLGIGVVLPDGETLRDVTLEAGALKSGNRPLGNFVGATLSAIAETGAPVILHIDSIAPADEKNGQVPQYMLSYAWREAGGLTSDAPPSWQPLCKDKAPAIAVVGTWDMTVGPGGGGKHSQVPTELTFACQGSAVAKCVSVLEYKPWANTPSGASLDLLHQSCVRAVRADYCGNGQSNTRHDEKINFYDSASVQRDAAEWPLEAIWSPDGARCVQSPRLTEVAADARTHRPKTKVLDYIKSKCPQILHACPPKMPSPSENPAWLYTEIAPTNP